MDIFIVGLYFVVIVSIGLYMGRREKSLEGYALGDRSMPWWAILASILAAEISAATFLGTPNEGYNKLNFTYAQLGIGTIIGRVVVGKLFLKPFYRYNVISIYEYLEKRFGLRTRRGASVVFLVSRALASGTRLYVAGILLVLALEMWLDAPLGADQKVLAYAGALTLVTVLTTVYTSIGGIKAVVWTDVIQACILVASVACVLCLLVGEIPGGFGGAMDWLGTHKDSLVVFTTGIPEESASWWQTIWAILGSEYTIFAALLGATFTTMATHGTDQDMVQRMLTAKDAKTGSRAVILSGLADVPVVLMFLSIGILLAVWAHYHPDSGMPGDQAFPWFIVHKLPVGIRGLLFAGLLSTAMGSLSTALNSLATTAVRDWYQGVFRPKADAARTLRAARWLTVGFALALIAIGTVTSYIVVHSPPSEKARILPIVLGIFGYTYGALLGIFLLGMTTKTRGSDRGNVLAMALSIVAMLFVCKVIPLRVITGWIPGAEGLEMPEIAFPWRVTAGTLLAFFVGLAFKTRPGEETANETRAEEELDCRGDGEAPASAVSRAAARQG